MKTRTENSAHPATDAATRLPSRLRGRLRHLSFKPAPAARWLPLLLGATALTWGLVSCGGSGGVDTGGTGQPTISSVVVGPITGFGSVVVGGVKFDDSAAAVVDEDGAPLPAADLQLGMRTTVEGGDITVGTGTGSIVPASTAKAYRIRVGEQLLGPVTAVDSTTCRVTVLGQRVVAVASTVVDSSLPVTTSACRLAGLRANQAGQALRVYGAWDAAQSRLVASRVELRTQVASYVLLAPVESYSLAERKMTLGGQRISLDTLPAAQLPASLADGSFVRLKLGTVQADGRWPALSLQSGEPVLPAGVATTVEGRVTQVTSAQQFSVNGLLVDARAAVVTPSGATVVLGAEVEVKGMVSGNTMVASKLEIDVDDNDNQEKEIEVEGTISALDTAAKTFVMRGTTVSYAANPSYEDSKESDLRNNRKAAVKGVLSADGRVLVATKIHIEL